MTNRDTTAGTQLQQITKMQHHPCRHLVSPRAPHAILRLNVVACQTKYGNCLVCFSCASLVPCSVPCPTHISSDKRHSQVARRTQRRVACASPKGGPRPNATMRPRPMIFKRAHPNRARGLGMVRGGVPCERRGNKRRLFLSPLLLLLVVGHAYRIKKPLF